MSRPRSGSPDMIKFNFLLSVSLASSVDCRSCAAVNGKETFPGPVVAVSANLADEVELPPPPASVEALLST